MNESNFAEWMKEVDVLVTAKWGMSIHDLPDMRFRDSADDDVTPEEFVEENIGSMDQLRELVFS
jgi:hypothetical protein